MTLGSIMSIVGGRAMAMYGIFAICMGSYEAFSFDKSILKNYYKEDSMEYMTQMSCFDGSEDENRSRMRTQLLLSN